MYGHIIALGSPSAAFFVLLQVFGKYVLLNLFLAILLENFDDIEAPEVSYFNYMISLQEESPSHQLEEMSLHKKAFHNI